MNWVGRQVQGLAVQGAGLHCGYVSRRHHLSGDLTKNVPLSSII